MTRHREERPRVSLILFCPILVPILTKYSSSISTALVQAVKRLFPAPMTPVSCVDRLLAPTSKVRFRTLLLVDMSSPFHRPLCTTKPTSHYTSHQPHASAIPVIRPDSTGGSTTRSNSPAFWRTFGPACPWRICFYAGRGPPVHFEEKLSVMGFPVMAHRQLHAINRLFSRNMHQLLHILAKRRVIITGQSNIVLLISHLFSK
jgi:hypothetical protein